jgi:hypothetical protein
MGKRFLLAAVACALLVTARPAGALYGLFLERFYPASSPAGSMLLYEWPQRGAQPGNEGWTLSLLRPNCYMGNSWHTTLPHSSPNGYENYRIGATGQPVTEYYGDRSAFAPFGTLFMLGNSTRVPQYQGNGGGTITAIRLESGAIMHTDYSSSNPRFSGTPAVMYLGDLWNGIYLIAASRGNDNWGTNSGVFTASYNVGYTYITLPGPPPTTIGIPGINRNSSYIYDVPGMVTRSPALFFNMCYVVNNRRNEARNSWEWYQRVPSSIFAYDTLRTPRSLSEMWNVPLQVGAGMDRPIPKGSAPPPSSELYHAVTTPIADDELVIVGAQKIGADWWSDDTRNDTQNDAAFFALNTRTGAQKWVAKISGVTIMPEPVLAGDLIIFGTDDGRAFALNRVDGSIRLQTAYSARVQGQTQPLNAPNQYETVKLYGPAVDWNRQYAYFGGSDGRVHRFDLNSGGIVSSPILTYFKTVWQRDGNGQPLLKPVSIGSAPIIFYNAFLFVKCFAGEYPCSKTADPAAADCEKSTSFLFCMSIPNMEMKSEFQADSFTGEEKYLYVHTGPDNATFTLDANGDVLTWCGFRRYGGIRAGIPLNNWIDYTYDKVRRMCYVTNTGGAGNGSYGVNNDSDTDADEYYDTDLGGVSLTNGYVVAADRGGNVIGIQSDACVNAFSPAGTWGPMQNPAPPFQPGPQLGDIQVYPNPFNPRKAVGGVMKFRNLPEGSVVELITLANERVRTLTAKTDNIVRWDGKNEAGQEVATGVYIYKIRLPDGKSVTGRLALVRK